MLAWSDFDQALHAIERAPGRAAFGPPRTLFDPTGTGAGRGVGRVDVAVGRAGTATIASLRGDATIAWEQRFGENRGRVAAVGWPAGSRPGAPHFVAGPARSGERQADRTC